MDDQLYAGLDLSTQIAVVVRSDLKLVHEAKVDFDQDFGHKYGVHNGVLANPAEGEIFAPVSMWLEALELLFERLKDEGLDFSRVKGISGAGMQHGTVFWSHGAHHLLEGLHADKSLVEQLGGDTRLALPRAFSSPYSTNWQDASTQAQCDLFDEILGNEHTLADITGSKAHHRFSGPQILRFRQNHPLAYSSTSRISLVSSFLCSLFLGKFAPIDISDVCGMNLWDIKKGVWHEDLLALTAGAQEGVEDLKRKLGPVTHDNGSSLGRISPYFVGKYGVSSDCVVAPFTGDNPSTILSLPLRPSDAIVSLGTSTTFLMVTHEYNPDPIYHFMNHPTTVGLYMFMLCYKNGSLARERVRNAMNAAQSADSTDINSYKDEERHKISIHDTDPWAFFNDSAISSRPLNQLSSADPMHLALSFPLPEIVPNVPAGEWHFTYSPTTHTLAPDPPISNNVLSPKNDQSSTNPRTILESQLLSLRLRSAGLVLPQHSADGPPLPPQPGRIYLVGGGSMNPAIQQLCGEVLGGAEGVYRLDIGGNACALGAAYKAVWVSQRGEDETFEELVGKRWREQDFVVKVDKGYRNGIWERYGKALNGFEMMEKAVLEQAGGGGKKQKVLEASDSKRNANDLY